MKKTKLIMGMILFIAIMLFFSPKVSAYYELKQVPYDDLKQALEKNPVYTIKSGETLKINEVIAEYVKHTLNCVRVYAKDCSLSNPSVATLSGDENGLAVLKGDKAGVTKVNMKVSTQGCSEYGTTTVNATIKLVIVPLANEFIDTYLKDTNGNVITEPIKDNFQKVLDSGIVFNTMTEDEKAKVDTALSEKETGLTYTELVEKATNVKKAIDNDMEKFAKDNLTGSDDKITYPVTFDNYEKVLASEEKWNALNDYEKSALNKNLDAKYTTMLGDAKVKKIEKEFINSALTFKEKLVSEANNNNYKTLLSGKDTWSKLTDAQKKDINDYLVANGVNKTYPELLAEAETVSGTVKTGDPAYVLAPLAVIALVGLVVVNKKMK